MPPRLPDKLYFKIGEVSRIVGVKPYVLRYWETEFDLLYTLAESAGQALSKEALLHRAWGDQHPERASAVDVSVFRLRRKLEAGGEPRLLHTKRGAGYVLKE